jgi:DNA-directed RNA polymerase subunit alpha
MEIKVEKAAAMCLAMRNLGDAKTIGKLVLDASFSPIRRVAAVESARVESVPIWTS